MFDPGNPTLKYCQTKAKRVTCLLTLDKQLSLDRLDISRTTYTFASRSVFALSLEDITTLQRIISASPCPRVVQNAKDTQQSHRRKAETVK